MYQLCGYDIQLCRGPNFGYRGKVVLAFEENGSSKIGVRFDRQIPDGNDLGGLCEEDHGFFCAGGSQCSVFFPSISCFIVQFAFLLITFSSFLFSCPVIANLLRPDTSEIEDYERLAIKELQEVFLFD